jgi:hypothetical protein
VVIVVAAVEELFVDADLGLFDEALPDGVALLGRAEAEEAEGGVGEAVFGGGLGKHLCRHAAGGEIDQIVALECGLAGDTVVFAEGVGYVTGFVGTGRLTRSGQDAAVGLDRIQVMPENRSGHVETLLGKTMHA